MRPLESPFRSAFKSCNERFPYPFIYLRPEKGTLSGGASPYSTNINHKGLQRTENGYAEERRIYKDLISKNNNVDILNSASRILQC